MYILFSNGLCVSTWQKRALENEGGSVQVAMTHHIWHKTCARYGNCPLHLSFVPASGFNEKVVQGDGRIGGSAPHAGVWTVALISADTLFSFRPAYSPMKEPSSLNWTSSSPESTRLSPLSPALISLLSERWLPFSGFSSLSLWEKCRGFRITSFHPWLHSTAYWTGQKGAGLNYLCFYHEPLRLTTAFTFRWPKRNNYWDAHIEKILIIILYVMSKVMSGTEIRYWRWRVNSCQLLWVHMLWLCCTFLLHF